MTKQHKTWPLVLTALGVVFGDIGTSPLYAIREAFYGEHSIPLTPDNVMGVLSLIVWSLVIVVSTKYLLFVMRADNKGEGGVLALTALVWGPRKLAGVPPGVLFLGLFGAALLFGDGILTPAITVLSAVEGLKVATPIFEPYVVPISIFILFVLFLMQRHGTAKIGNIFGPMILIWFGSIGILGLVEIFDNPGVIAALNPYYAVHFSYMNSDHALIVLAAVFLVVTGAEALYADMGHFGREPIKRAWFIVVFPCLILNYFGQGALLIRNPAAAVNPFFGLCPDWFLYPMVGIATTAAIIASQALISGVFSLTRQAVQLGYAPRIKIIHTSAQEVGQIYVPFVNWTLLVLTIWVVLEFGSSSRLAGAYGIAISITMVITTLLAGVVARKSWNWSRLVSVTVLAVFLAIDVVFFAANSMKIHDGGWFPITLGFIIFALMTTWKRGRRILMKRLRQQSEPFPDFMKRIEGESPLRVRGTAVFMTGDKEGTPPALLHNLKHNHILHERIVLLTILTEDAPRVPFNERVEIEKLGQGFYRITGHYGFMETPNIMDILDACRTKGVTVNLGDITFFLGRETLLSSDTPSMSLWRKMLFSFMSRNAERATTFFNIPPDKVVEIGLQIRI